MKLKPNKSVVRHKPSLHGGLYSVDFAYPGLIDFSSNINPLGCHPKVTQYLKKRLNLLSIYPDSYSRELKKNIKNYTKISEPCIAIGNGGTEIIYNFCRAFLNQHTPILIPIPTFSEYEVASKLQGCKISYFKTMNLNEDIDSFISKIPSMGCVFICNPNNPTGLLVQKNNIKKILKVSRKKSTLVFVDESFIELSNPNQTVIKYLKTYKNLFVLRSLTKSFGLAGIRVGYGLGDQKLVSILNKIKIPWNVNIIAQTAACIAFRYKNYLKKTKKLLDKESKYLINSISSINGFSCFETDTNFILIRTKIKSQILQKKLLKKKILIRDCSSFKGLNDNYIRISVKTHKDNIRLIRAMELV